jgi:putative membrane protein insertion efficiency factor
MTRLIALLLRGLIRTYQLVLSPVLGPRCRFVPSCSAYTAEAITTHGPLHGVGLGIRRLCRCHPWGGEGFDPVPAAGLRCEPAAPMSPSSATPL